jgi:hypothetical protein
MNKYLPLLALFSSAIIFPTGLTSCGTECEYANSGFESNNTPNTATLLQFDQSIEAVTHGNKARYYKASIDRPSTLRFKITNNAGLPDTIIQIYGPGNELIYTNYDEDSQRDFESSGDITIITLRNVYGFITGKEIFIEAGKVGDYKLALQPLSLEQSCVPTSSYSVNAIQKI